MTHASTIPLLHKLFKDFPAPRNPSVRLVILLTVFGPPMAAGTTAAAVKERLAAFDLLPLTRSDVVRVLSSPFLEKPGALLKFARIAVPGFEKEEPEVVRETVQACLANNCKVRQITSQKMRFTRVLTGSFPPFFSSYPSLLASFSAFVPAGQTAQGARRPVPGGP